MDNGTGSLFTPPLARVLALVSPFAHSYVGLLPRRSNPVFEFDLDLGIALWFDALNLAPIGMDALGSGLLDYGVRKVLAKHKSQKHQ